jgi:hypothetical protein
MAQQCLLHACIFTFLVELCPITECADLRINYGTWSWLLPPCSAVALWRFALSGRTPDEPVVSCRWLREFPFWGPVWGAALLLVLRTNNGSPNSCYGERSLGI